MRLYNPLNRVLGSEVKVKTLRLLCQSGGDINGRQLAKMLKVAPMTAHLALKELADEMVLELRTVGKTHLYSLNTEGWIVKDLLKPLFKSEFDYPVRFFEVLAKKIKESSLKDEILSVAVFGSVFRKEERATSDLDLFIVIKDGRQKRPVEDLIFEIDRLNLMNAGMALEPHVNALSEFQEKHKTGLSLIKDVLKGNKIIYGKKLEALL